MKARPGIPWKEWLAFVLLNFATPIAFFVMFRVAGAKPAITLAILVTFIQIIAHLVYGRAFSPFFLVGSGFTILFGVSDLVVHTPRYFRLAPAAENFIMGAIFIGTVFTRKPIVAWFAESLPDFIRPDIAGAGHAYVRKVTVVWGLYFLFKGAVFLYAAFKIDLGSLILFRSVFGGVTFLIMFAGEILYRRSLK